MTAEQPPADFWLLADPAQEVLVEGQPLVRLLAPVPLRTLGLDSAVAGEPYRPNAAAADA
jgi:hypothetical protein